MIKICNFVALLVIVLLSGCATESIQTTETIEIGGIFALSGYGSQWGMAEMKSVELAIDERNAAGGIHGKHITLIVEDSQTEAVTAVGAYTKLRDIDQVEFIIGTTWEKGTSVIAPLANEDDMLLITPSSYVGIENEQSEHMFSTMPPYKYEIISVAPFFETKGWNSYAIVHSTDFFSEIMRELFITEAERNGWNIEGVYGQSAEDVEYATVVSQLAILDVDVVYAPLSNAIALGNFITAMKKQGLDIPVISVSSSQDFVLLENFGPILEDTMYYAYPVASERYGAFVSSYERAYGIEPESPSAANAYDAANLLFDALESGQDVATYLHEVEYDGASNYISFDENGIISEKEYVLKTVSDGEFVLAD